MLRVLANSSRKDLRCLRLAERARQACGHTDQHEGECRRHQPQRARKPMVSSNRPPTKKPAPFIAFLEPVNQATHLNNCPEPPSDVALIADFEAVLVMSLATPAMPWAATTQATDSAALQCRVEGRERASGR